MIEVLKLEPQSLGELLVSRIEQLLGVRIQGVGKVDQHGQYLSDSHWSDFPQYAIWENVQKFGIVICPEEHDELAELSIVGVSINALCDDLQIVIHETEESIALLCKGARIL